MINQFSYKKIFTAAVLTGCFFMYSCENDVNEVRELGRRKISVDEGKGIDSYLSMNGKMRAHLTAPLLLRYQGDSAGKSEFPKSLHVDFYNDSLQIQSQLNARYGRYLENDNKVFLRDSVVAFNIKGDSLFCEELYWDQNQQKFYTNKKVIISRNFRNSLFIGLDGMTCNQDLSDLHLYRMQPGTFFTLPPDSSNAKPDSSTIK